MRALRELEAAVMGGWRRNGGAGRGCLCQSSLCFCSCHSGSAKLVNWNRDEPVMSPEPSVGAVPGRSCHAYVSSSGETGITVSKKMSQPVTFASFRMKSMASLLCVCLLQTMNPSSSIPSHQFSGMLSGSTPFSASNVLGTVYLRRIPGLFDVE